MIIIREIFAARFLRSAEHNAQTAFGRHLLLLENFQTIQRHNGCALVVCRAAPKAMTVTGGHDKRISLPAVSGRDNIHMGQHGGRLFPLAIFGMAGIIVHVLHGEAHALRHGKNGLQRAGGFAAKRHSRLSRGTHGRNRHQRGKVAQNVILIFENLFTEAHQIFSFAMNCQSQK